MTPGRQPPRSLLTELAEVVPGSDRGLVAELQRRSAERLLRVLVAVATTLRHGDPRELTATLVNGSRRAFPVAASPLLGTETGHSANRRGVAEVTLSLPAALLAKGVELVDTSGVGRVYEHNTDAALAANSHQLEALATVVRQHLPRPMGRQRTVRHVAAWAPPLAAETSTEGRRPRHGAAVA